MRLPRELKQQSLLWVHLADFAGGEAEELRVEAVDLVEKIAGPGVHAALAMRVRMVPAKIPAIALRLAYCIATRDQRLPQQVRRIGAAGIAPADADHGNGAGEQAGGCGRFRWRFGEGAHRSFWRASRLEKAHCTADGFGEAAEGATRGAGDSRSACADESKGFMRRVLNCSIRLGLISLHAAPSRGLDALLQNVHTRGYVSRVLHLALAAGCHAAPAPARAKP